MCKSIVIAVNVFLAIYKQTPYVIKKYVNNFFYCLSRYATTLVTSEVHNPETRSREIFMTVILPDTAFISRFAIELGGQLFVAYVREKENAWREYQEAVSKGKTAGKYEQILENLFWIMHPTTYLVGCVIQKRNFLPVLFIL